jgi:hypothetical protein
MNYYYIVIIIIITIIIISEENIHIMGYDVCIAISYYTASCVSL